MNLKAALEQRRNDQRSWRAVEKDAKEGRAGIEEEMSNTRQHGQEAR